MRSIQRVVGAFPRRQLAASVAPLSSGLPRTTTARTLHTSHAVNASSYMSRTPFNFNAGRCFTTAAGQPRTLISNDEGTVTVGPGYVSYAGPSPASDKTGIESVSSAITYSRLRDCCPCPRCIHPSTRQKTHTSGEAFRETFELGNEVLDGRTVHPATNAEGEHGIEVHWPVAIDGHPHASFYPISLLQRLASGRVRGHTYLNDTLRRKLWDRESLLKDGKDLWIDFSELNGAADGEPFQLRPEVHLRLLEQLQLYGVAVVRGLPTDRTDNTDCRLREFAETIGGLRNTFYGETWDVKSVVNSKNVAYTNLNLGLHMDLL